LALNTAETSCIYILYFPISYIFFAGQTPKMVPFSEQDEILFLKSNSQPK